MPASLAADGARRGSALRQPESPASAMLRNEWMRLSVFFSMEEEFH